MPRRTKVDPALAIEVAFRQEVLGHKGVFYQGKVRSSAELRSLATEPLFPLAPFDGYSYYTRKTDSAGSDM